MTYAFAKTLNCSFASAIERTTSALTVEGFGVLTDIDVAETLRKKLGVDFRPYRILGACNTPLAHEALQAEPRIGLMLPCNVVVQELGHDQVEVAAIDPVAAMAAVGNPALAASAEHVRAKLRRVVEAL